MIMTKVFYVDDFNERLKAIKFLLIMDINTFLHIVIGFIGLGLFK